jgi:hypothetical protein
VLTIFATAKPFHGHTGVIQRNAIASWTLLRPRPEVILFGNEPGTAEVCREFGLTHVPELAVTEFGAPLLPDLFEKAQRIAAHENLCYVNSDIMLMGDFLEALRKVSDAQRRFLMVGRRWDVSIREIWDFKARGGDNGLRDFVSHHGNQAPAPGNSDFFAFPKGMWNSIPPLAVGRAAWDPWLIYEARRLGGAVVDASTAVMAIHQSHDQSDYPHGLRQWRRELNLNWDIVGKEAGRFCLWDSTHLVTPTGLRPSRGVRYLIRRVDTLHLFYPRLGALLKIPRLAAARLRSSREKKALASDPLRRLVNLVRANLPADGVTAILGLSGDQEPNQNGNSLGLLLANSLTWAGMPTVVYDPERSAMEHARCSLGGPITFATSVKECVSDADVIVIAARHQEFCSLPVDTLVRARPTRHVIDCCELWKGHAAREHLDYAAWSEK